MDCIYCFVQFVRADNSAPNALDHVAIWGLLCQFLHFCQIEVEGAGQTREVGSESSRVRIFDALITVNFSIGQILMLSLCPLD